MNFQEKLLEASAELRTRAATIAASARKAARHRARLISVLEDAGREFGKVARRHAGQFLKQNSSIASAVRKDVSELARSTYASLSARPAARKGRRAPAARRRTARAA